ncbi:carbohydrate ABC transporter permease [Cohnella fermenti]|uniref:Carbohydrate ABC transporter permease n=1 Tax=Cohnella fermenti TaxID=2565925 RepID=A0A4S4BPE8_9BACL|nr:carbohydrate ABC transporter permease [Cohnella fermenti]THF76740.1 carbohydrate ABC transporter permease [Cohnella fermenti]
MSRQRSRWAAESAGILASLLVVLPLFFVVVNSFKDKAGAAAMSLALPKKWYFLDNYSEMIDAGGVLTGLKNSAIVTFITVAALVILSSMTAFTLQRKNTRMSGLLYLLVLLGLMIPLQIIPAYFVTYYLHVQTYLAAIVMLVVTNFSFGTFLYTGFFKSIPREIDESAIMDGVGPYGLFFSIIFPLLRPVTVTLIIIAFMGVWNDFGITIYFLNSPRNFTVTLTIFNFLGTYSSDWNLIFANVVLVSAPVVLVYLLLQRHIIDGMTAGSVKG